ncbi:MAG: hypothetical protein HY706_07150 [Candidatus Hydrogenedentes bacterium]|nr:hypothetical protein [Candidatus Hydrogenedentota bacterium]
MNKKKKILALLLAGIAIGVIVGIVYANYPGDYHNLRATYIYLRTGHEFPNPPTEAAALNFDTDNGESSDPSDDGARGVIRFGVGQEPNGNPANYIAGNRVANERWQTHAAERVRLWSWKKNAWVLVEPNGDIVLQLGN